MSQCSSRQVGGACGLASFEPQICCPRGVLVFFVIRRAQVRQILLPSVRWALSQLSCWCLAQFEPLSSSQSVWCKTDHAADAPFQ